MFDTRNKKFLYFRKSLLKSGLNITHTSSKILNDDIKAKKVYFAQYNINITMCERDKNNMKNKYHRKILAESHTGPVTYRVEGALLSLTNPDCAVQTIEREL